MIKPRTTIFDLPLDEKFKIASCCLATEFLSELAISNGITREALMDENLKFLKQQLGTEMPSEAHLNSILKQFLEIDESL
ncbi:hypothetical protein [Microcoleus sp. K4-B3]|uniref:hypothetical protein n=1 Tax=Microcoleus sp. K4-B3 TaxID=2818791 RepID=UPI002FD4E13F